MPDVAQKVTPRHLQRNAYLYVRQSSLRQVMENTESTKRQYALRQRAVALGWAMEQVIVIDEDLGQSGADSRRRGFQHLVAEVGTGRAGIVMGLEVSRLARNSMDWHRLLEICALSDTLILDEDGIYDPSHFNDRLLLGLKGTLSEAELHVLRARLQGGIENRARRGELRMPLPIGLVYVARWACRLYRLGGLRGQPAPLARKRHGAWRSRPSPGPASRGAGVVAGAGALWALWHADDGALRGA